MQIRLLVSRGGPAGVHNAGDVIDVSDAEAGRMIAAGQAVPEVPPTIVETAAAVLGAGVERAARKVRTSEPRKV